MKIDYNNLVSPISSRKRRNKIDENIKSYYKEKEIEKQNMEIINEAISDGEENDDLEIASNTAAKNKSKRDSVKTTSDDFDQNVEECLSNLFGMIVYESIPIDKEAKMKDARSIIENASQVFKTLYENNTVVITQSPTFKDYAGAVVKQVECTNGRLTEDQIEEVLSTIFSDHYIDLKNIIKNVYDKSANTIRVETDIKEYRDKAYDKEFISTNSNYVKENFTPTLFRYLNENKIEEITKTDEVDKLNREDILNLSLAEALADYVILETLNTTKLINFDTDGLRSIIKY